MSRSFTGCRQRGVDNLRETRYSTGLFPVGDFRFVPEVENVLTEVVCLRQRLYRKVQL